VKKRTRAITAIGVAGVLAGALVGVIQNRPDQPKQSDGQGARSRSSLIISKSLSQPVPIAIANPSTNGRVALDKASHLGPSAEDLTDALGRNWHKLKDQPRPRTSVPSVRRPQQKRAGNFAGMERAFRALPPDFEWVKNSPPVLRDQRDRLGRRGIDLVSVECRTGVCRYELEFKEHRATRRHQLLKGKPSTRATADRLVHTWFPTPEVAKTVIFLGRNGQELPST
jgi:hypothetical protein